MKLNIKNWALDYSSEIKVKRLDRFNLFIAGGPKVPVPDHPLPYFYCSWAEVILSKAKAISQQTGVKIIGENKTWDTAFMDCGNPAWASYLLETVIEPGIETGYKGVFIDTFDGMEDAANNLGYPDPSPERTRLYAGGSRFIWRIDNMGEKDFGIITNRGFPQCQKKLDDVSRITECPGWMGLMIESAWHSKIGPVPQSERLWLWAEMDNIENRDFTVLTLDYCKDKAKAQEIIDKSQKHGYVPLVVQSSLTPPKIVAYPGKES